MVFVLGAAEALPSQPLPYFSPTLCHPGPGMELMPFAEEAVS